MSEYQLAAETRTATGKGPARRARAAGKVPAVLYGHGMTPLNLTIDARALTHALRTEAGANVLLELQVDGARHLTLAKEIQRHPVRGTLIHVDFLLVRRGEQVTVQIPVHLVGEAPGVREGGMAAHELHHVNVEAEVTRVPESIEADVSGLGIGDVLRVGDLTAPAGASIVDDPELPVISVVAPAAPAEAAEAEAEAAAAEAAEGEGGAPSAAGGEGPAAGS